MKGERYTEDQATFSLRKNESETSVVCRNDRSTGFVSWNGTYSTWLYVDPVLQRRGIGRRLL